jgi:hypothetical protein
MATPAFCPEGLSACLQNNASDIHNAQGTLPSCCGNAFFLKPAANERTPAACDLKPLHMHAQKIQKQFKMEF